MGDDDDSEDLPIGSELRPLEKAPAAEPPALEPVEAERKFTGLPLPQALRAHFQFESTPASLLKYNPALWETGEIQAAIATLHQLEASSPSARRRKWATRELDAAFAACVARSLDSRGERR